MKEKKKFDLEALIEKYRFWIGGILVVLILVGGGILLWRENYQKPSQEDRINKLEAKIDELESAQKISKSELQMTNENSNPQNSNIQADSSGQVAGSQSQGSSAKGQVVTGKVNINTANAAQLDTLPGIGTAYAQRIIDYRNSHGGFKSIEEIKNVKGIGDKTFEKMRELISV
ncbi:MAG: helix-hairpin-helix domain-containing protein [bacterium]|nr:helix-hairpin-helix domain-containing protein [bacterium]